VQVPSYDVRQYVQTTLITLAIGFGAGITVGKVFRNRRSSRPRRNAGKRRTSARQRKRGRPAGGTVDDTLTVKLPAGPVDVIVRRGDVMVDGERRGSIYDLGTTFRAVPDYGDVRSYGTLAGAVKHVVRR
jgi:hypothetical protein